MNKLLRHATSTTIIVLIPALVTVFLVYVRFHATLFDFTPSWNDEIFYWHQIQSFSSVGFGNGYYVFNEIPARISFSHYGPHGPFFPMLYGMTGRSLGWREYSGPILNLSGLALTTIILLWNIPNQRRHRLKVGLILLTFWPLLLYIPSNMQESLHASAAIVFSTIFYRLFSRRDKLVCWQFCIFAGLIFLFALTRPTWSLLFVPLFLYHRDKSSSRQVMLSCVYAALLSGLVFIIFQSFSAPYPNFMSGIANEAHNLPAYGLGIFFQHCADNLRGYFDIYNGTTLEILLRYQILFILLLVGLSVLHTISPLLGHLRKFNCYSVFHALNLGRTYFRISLLRCSRLERLSRTGTSSSAFIVIMEYAGAKQTCLFCGRNESHVCYKFRHHL